MYLSIIPRAIFTLASFTSILTLITDGAQPCAASGRKPTQTAQHTSTTSAAAHGGTGRYHAPRPRHTVPPPTRDRRVAVGTPTRLSLNIRPHTSCSSRRMQKPRCLCSRRRWAGSTGRGARSRPFSGVTARRGRTGTCRPRHTRPRSSAEIQCPISQVWGCQSIIDEYI